MAVRDVVNAIAAFSLFADLTGPQLEEVAHAWPLPPSPSKP
jgi:hypothetical protein